jgi:general secretion pathway protein A
VRVGVSQFYLDHYGFSVRPFSILPDPGMLFWSDRHRKAFAVLEYGLMTRAPLTVVTGEVGVGKTTLIQALLRQAEADLRIGLISNARGDRGDLLRWVLNAFDITTPQGADYVQLFQMFQDFVLSEYAAGRLVVLIFDEAQNLGAEMLEELRMLTNINSGTDELLQLVLLGQPELREIITRPELRQFAQRVSATFHLGAFDAETTRNYIRHRLQKAGGTGEEIDAAAAARIHAEARGVPRMINKIADLVLVYGAAADLHLLSADLVDEVINDGLVLTAPEPSERSTRLVLAHEKDMKREMP